MPDIYQEIWDADQQHAGLKPVRKGTPIDGEFRSPNDRHLRTFYPEFTGMA